MSFTIRHLKAHGGLNLTASHNPPDDNGNKFYDGNAQLSSSQAIAAYARYVRFVSGGAACRDGRRARRHPSAHGDHDPQVPFSESVRLVEDLRKQKVDVALSTASGFGGFQSAMIFGRPKESR